MCGRNGDTTEMWKVWSKCVEIGVLRAVGVEREPANEKYFGRGKLRTTTDVVRAPITHGRKQEVMAESEATYCMLKMSRRLTAFAGMAMSRARRGDTSPWPAKLRETWLSIV
eukprot:11132823-Alexandrium_andersonii.AAC.1